VLAGIEATYLLLLRSYKQSGNRAGWGWCSLAEADLYHTWSVSQTLGDMEDYVFAPSKAARYASDPGLDKLRRRLQEATPRSFLRGDVKSPTESIYREACRWLYGELTATVSPAIKEEVSDVNALENEIYYTFFLVETLVYMHADELLPAVLNVSRETILNTLYEKLFIGSNRLGALRDTAWYGSEEQSTLAIPLPLSPGKKMKDQLLEPSLEPLVLRALSYGPVYLKKRDILDFVEAAVTRHANVLDEKLDLWDEKGANFLICERTVEALFMVRNMFRNTSEMAIAPPLGSGGTQDERGAGMTLTLSGDQVIGLVDAVTNRVLEDVRGQVGELVATARPAAGSYSPDQLSEIVDTVSNSVLERIRTQVEELVATTQPAHGSDSTTGNAGDIQSLVDPEGYIDIVRPENILLYLDDPGGPSEATLYQTMLLETIVKLLTSVLRSSRPAPASGSTDASLSQKLADGLAHAIASSLPRAVAYFLNDRIERLGDDGDVLRAAFDGRRIEMQVDRVALAYLEKELKQPQPLDLAGGLSETLDKLDRLPGGSK
jgi:hypothetical protein